MLGGVLRDNVGLLLALSAALLTALRLLAVTRGDLNTAVALLSSAGTGTVLLGAVLSLMPHLLPLAAYSAAIAWLGAILFGWRPVGLGVLTSVLWALAVFLTPWPSAALAAGGTAVLGGFAVRRWRPRRRPSEPAPAGRVRIDARIDRHRAFVWVARLSLGMAAGTLLYGVIWAAPWWPAEKITVDGETQAGYVIEETDAEVVLLTLDDRALVRIASEGRERQMCTAGDAAARTLSQILFGSQRDPGCG